MTAWAYYNEFDPHAAAWLRNLISMGAIAPGEVDERDIRTVAPDDLRGFGQCHFFAGIGVWSYSLRRAGIPDDEPVWTGSCPCQGFSAAGRQRGFDDERHLWPEWYRLIRARRPRLVWGEQVASALVIGKARRQASEHGTYGLYEPDRETQVPSAWLDLVLADMEDARYAMGVRAAPAASVGSPQIRLRTFFVARRLEHANGGGEGAQSAMHRAHYEEALGAARADDASSLSHRTSAVGGLEDTEREGLEGLSRHGGRDGRRPGKAGSVAEGSEPRRVARSDGRDARSERQQRGGEYRQLTADSSSVRLAFPSTEGREKWRGSPAQGSQQPEFGPRDIGNVKRMADNNDIQQWQGRSTGSEEGQGFRANARGRVIDRRPGPVDGFWRDSDWVFCRDGRWRPIEPGTFPLVDGAAFRMGSGSPFEGKSRQEMLRGYGNAIVSEAAISFIEDYLEATGLVVDSDASLSVSSRSSLTSDGARERDLEDLI